MAVPYQCLLASSTVSAGQPQWTLFGASGPKLAVQSSSGATAEWPLEKHDVKNTQEDEPEEPPGKKMKLSSPSEKGPNFSTMVLSSEGRYLVAITGEDKCVRVFQVQPNCQLQQLSERIMPRRPSAITLTPDNSTILCADKFGDVYALPLLWSPEDEPVETSTPEPSESGTSKDFMPSASVLTVHSGRNRRILEEQLKQGVKKQPKTKEPAKFKHELLSGHVSMLTDIMYATTDPGKPRGYILTADRDEHIRISRAPPQAHIIEGFCLGHEGFVSRLCMTPSGLLVSGGGDRQLFVWNWLNPQLLDTVDIAGLVWDYLKDNNRGSSLSADKSNFNVAVSGIWGVPQLPQYGRQHSGEDEILVACEGVPALFHFHIGGQRGNSKLLKVLPLRGNALGLAFIHSRTAESIAVVSVDNFHKPGSTTDRRDEEDTSRLQCLNYMQNGQWSSSADMESELEWFSCQAGYHRSGNLHASSSTDDASVSKEGVEGARIGADEKALRDVLYGLENLRKRPGAED